MSRTHSEELEILVARIQKQLAPQATVSHNVMLDGRLSGRKRQIDVLVYEKVGQYDISIVIDCKDYKTPVDVKGVEEFSGLLQDVGAQKGVLVCPSGFTKAAKQRAQSLQIDLYSPVDTDPHKWQVRVTMPAICDFRSASISFALSVSSPMPWKVPYDFHLKLPIFEPDGRELGTAIQAAMAKWNAGQYPIELGTHEGLPIAETTRVVMENGYGQLVEIDLTARIRVQQELYYGQYPIDRISGFKDEFSGKVIANAFQVGLLDPDHVEKQWRKVEKEEDCPVQPVLYMTGLVAWAE